MIQIGCNYIVNQDGKNRYDDLYSYLVKNNYIDILKFPGKLCNYVEFNNCLNLVNKLKIKIDLHGLPHMEPRTHSKRMLKNIEWNKLTNNLMVLNNKKRISTHIGAENNENINEATYILNENIKYLKDKFYEKYNEEIKFGGENQSGGYKLPLVEISPKTISDTWNTLDFGVFDISHAKLAAIDLKISYEDYLKSLFNKEKVKILHVSGNVDQTGKFGDKVDKHLMMDKTEIKDIIKTIKEFKNLDLIISEFAFNSKYSFEKELIIEMCTLNKIVKTLDEKECIKTYDYLSANLDDDLSNLDYIKSI